MKAICNSGGAPGADTVFGELAELAGHEVHHYSFLNHKSACRHLIILNEFQLSEANEPLKEANKILKRRYPTRSWYVNNLLKRNYFQIKDSNRIYAVTPLIDSLPSGGTGWAVTMGILRGINSVYVYDVNTHSWWHYECFHRESNVMEWAEMDIPPPKPFGLYAGIGSHELTSEGEQAIRELYAQ